MRQLKSQESSSWISLEEYDARRELNKKFAQGMMWGFPKRESKEDDNVKLAHVTIGGKRHMIGVDNKTMVGYAIRDDIPTWKLPLEELKYDTFERWCTSFDV